MPFSLEDKITYNELAPSLQAMLGINKYNDMIEDMIQKADNGQLIKVGKDKTIFADDDFYLIRAAVDQSEVDHLKAVGPIDLKEVFASWNRISAYGGYGLPYQNSNVGDQAATRNMYSYNDNNKSIYTNGNNGATSGFISDRLYSKFWIHERMYGLDADDDCNIFIIAYMVDKNNVFHDISVIRDGGGAGGAAYEWVWAWNVGQFVLAYDYVARGGTWSDMYTPGVNNRFKVLNAVHCPKVSGWNGRFADFYAEKKPGYIKCKTGDIGSTSFNDNYTLEFILPDEKIPGWSDEDWNNLRYMMLNPCPVGFGAQSQNSRFMIVDQQEIFEEDNIYDLEEDAIYAFINNEWVKIGKTSDILPHKVWLYNNILNNLYWYDSPGKYIKIESNMIGNIKTAAEGQLPKIMNDGTIDMHDNFIKLYAVDNNIDFSHAQSVLTTDGDTIYRLDINKKYVYFRATANWVEKPIDLHDIPCRIFIYNEALHRFFFYTEPGVYYRMTLRNFDVI